MIRVFSAGLPADSMWLEPVGTWTDIITGRRSADGLFIRAEDALRLIAEAHVVGAATNAPDWCGSEGGTPYADITKCGEPESDAARAERIASVKADKSIDQQNDNKP